MAFGFDKITSILPGSWGRANTPEEPDPYEALIAPPARGYAPAAKTRPGSREGFTSRNEEYGAPENTQG